MLLLHRNPFLHIFLFIIKTESLGFPCFIIVLTAVPCDRAILSAFLLLHKYVCNLLLRLRRELRLRIICGLLSPLLCRISYDVDVLRCINQQMDIVCRATGEYHPDVLPDIYEITGTKCQLQHKNLLVFPAGLCNIFYKMLHFEKSPILYILVEWHRQKKS